MGCQCSWMMNQSHHENSSTYSVVETFNRFSYFICMVSVIPHNLHFPRFTKSSQNPCSRLTRSIQKPQLRLIWFRRIYCQLVVLVTAGTRGRSRHPVTSLTTETCPGVSVSPLRGGFGGYFAHHTGLTDRPSDPTYTNTYSNASVKRPPSLQPLFDYFLVVMRYSHTLNCFAGNRSR